MQDIQQQIQALEIARQEWLIECLVRMIEALMKELEDVRNGLP